MTASDCEDVHYCTPPQDNLMTGRRWECPECYARWSVMRAKFTTLGTDTVKRVGSNTLIWWRMS